MPGPNVCEADVWASSKGTEEGESGAVSAVAQAAAGFVWSTCGCERVPRGMDQRVSPERTEVGHREEPAFRRSGFCPGPWVISNVATGRTCYLSTLMLSDRTRGTSICLPCVTTVRDRGDACRMPSCHRLSWESYSSEQNIIRVNKGKFWITWVLNFLFHIYIFQTPWKESTGSANFLKHLFPL